jgi:hypothetical protein
VGLKLIFLVVSRVMSLIRLSHRESWWKDAEILMPRHQLFTLAVRRHGDVRLYTEVLPAMTAEAVSPPVDADPGQAAEVARAALGHIGDPDLRWADAAGIITRLHRIAVRAGETGDLALLEEAVGVVLAWDTAWDQLEPQKQIRHGLARLRGDQAAAAARALREHADARHFTELADDRRADERIRRAARPAGMTREPPREDP